jgi:hypothetical protein
MSWFMRFGEDVEDASDERKLKTDRQLRALAKK